MASLLNPTTKETAGPRGKVAITRTPGKGKGKVKSLDNDVGPPPEPNPEFQTGWKFQPGVLYTSLFAQVHRPTLGMAYLAGLSPTEGTKVMCDRFHAWECAG
jgi:hypothetical protein